MALPIKYGPNQPTRSGLRKGLLVVGTGNEDYGPTATTTYWNNINIPTDGYIVTTLGLNNSPISFAATTSAKLILIDNYLGGTATTLAAAKEYLCARANTWLLENHPNNIVTDDLVFDLNARSLSSYPGSGTSAMDLSGLGRDGSLDNGVGFNPKGYFVFDGVDDRIVLNNTLDAPFTTQNWTVDIWFRIDSTYVSYDAMLGNGYPFQLYVAGGKVITYLSSAAGSGNYFLSGMTSTQTISTETWYHLSFVRDGTNYYYYINGVLDKSSTSSTSVCAAANQNAQIGNLWNVNDDYSWDGDISNVKIYKKSLTQAEINQNYYQGPIVTDGLIFAVDAGNLVSYAGGGYNLTSLIGSNTGTLTNGVGFDSNYGGSFDLDGVDDYITLSTAVSNTIYTLNFWYKTGANDGSYGYFSTDSSSPSKGFAISEGGTFGGLSYGKFYYYDGVSVNVLNQTTLLTTNKWYNIAAVIDTSSNNIKVYINGVLDVNQTINAMATSVDEIGRWKSGNVNFLNGSMASYKIYNKALTSSEILQNYNAIRARFVKDTFTVASGGSITTDGDYKIHTFTSSGTFTVTGVGENPGGFEYLIVAGGGGGGYETAGGGGAGGFLNNVSVSVSATAHTVTVGAGGGGATNASNGANGGDSSVFSITADGGGVGGSSLGAGVGKDGGSGGGGKRGFYAGGSATSGQGNDGGLGGAGANTFIACAGGGGGAGAVGQAGGIRGTGFGGNGGDGLQSDISGTNTYYAGGGGGGSYEQSNVLFGEGGAGGGGRAASLSILAQPGTVNTGGGGGGGQLNNINDVTKFKGADGGSGIVIIRYKFQ